MSQTFILWANDPTRPHVAANLRAYIDGLSPKKSYRFEICEHRKTQTDDQLGARFGLAYKTIMQHMGLQGDDEKKQLHRFMCCEYFGYVETPFGRRPKRTTTVNERGEKKPLDTVEAAEFYDYIVRKAAEFDIFIPEPNPFWKEASHA
jgi:hypothetical protein